MTLGSKTQQKHHVGTSSLINLEPKIDMAFSFFLGFIYLACLGVMKSLLFFWLAKTRCTKLGYRSREILSNRLENLKTHVCFECQRKPRSTKAYGHWKATEFRFLLLYGGPLVLRGLFIIKNNV